ncbi:MAG: PAQR family membrane homeostasis protein TrhA [Promethearchaeota archaeon]
MLTTVPEERFNTLSHLFGGILTIFGTILLIIRSDGDRLNIIVCLIWGISNATLFFASTICHSKKLDEDHKSVWTTVDQIAIYMMITGTYTPITVFYMTGNWLVGILLGQWIFAGVGIVLKFIKPNSPRWITAGIYLIQGWMLLPAGKILFEAVPSFIFGMIVAGGLFYSIGVIFYVTKRPKLKPGVFGAHELWHIFVLLGALSFYIVIFQSL